MSDSTLDQITPVFPGHIGPVMPQEELDRFEERNRPRLSHRFPERRFRTEG